MEFARITYGGLDFLPFLRAGQGKLRYPAQVPSLELSSALAGRALLYKRMPAERLGRVESQ